MSGRKEAFLSHTGSLSLSDWPTGSEAAAHGTRRGPSRPATPVCWPASRKHRLHVLVHVMLMLPHVPGWLCRRTQFTWPSWSASVWPVAKPSRTQRAPRRRSEQAAASRPWPMRDEAAYESAAWRRARGHEAQAAVILAHARRQACLRMYVHAWARHGPRPTACLGP